MYRVTHKDMGLQRRMYGICLVRFLAFRFLIDQNRVISVLNHSVNHQNTQLIAEPKTKLQIVIFVESSLQKHLFVDNPV